MQGTTTLVSSAVRLSLPSSVDVESDGLIDVSAVIVDVLTDVRPGHKSMHRPPVNRSYRCYSVRVEDNKVKLGGVSKEIDSRTKQPVHLAKTYKELGLPHRRMVNIHTRQEYSWSRGNFYLIDADGRQKEVRLDDNFKNFELELWQRHKHYDAGSGIRRVIRDSRTVFADSTPQDVQQAVVELEEALTGLAAVKSFSWSVHLPVYVLTVDKSSLKFDEDLLNSLIFKVALGQRHLQLQRAGASGTLIPKLAPGTDPKNVKESDVLGYRIVETGNPNHVLSIETRLPDFVFSRFEGEVKEGDVLQIADIGGHYENVQEFKENKPEMYRYIRMSILEEYIQPYGEEWYIVDITVLDSIPEGSRCVVQKFRPVVVVLPQQTFSGRFQTSMLRNTPLSTVSGHLEVDLVSLPEAWTARRMPSQQQRRASFESARTFKSTQRSAPVYESTAMEIPAANRPQAFGESMNITVPGLNEDDTRKLLREAERVGLSTSDDDEFTVAMEAAIANVGDVHVPETRENGNILRDHDVVTDAVTPGTPLD